MASLSLRGAIEKAPAVGLDELGKLLPLIPLIESYGTLP
jgi:hypothetical protein